MTAAANLLGALFVLQVPEGGEAWMYLLIASVACVGAWFYGSRLGRRRND